MEMTGQQVAIVTGASTGNRGRPCRGLPQTGLFGGRQLAHHLRLARPPVRAVAGDIADPTTADRIVATLPDYRLFTPANVTGFFHLTRESSPKCWPRAMAVTWSQ
jgi:hypothetical protein